MPRGKGCKAWRIPPGLKAPDIFYECLRKAAGSGRTALKKNFKITKYTL